MFMNRRRNWFSWITHAMIFTMVWALPTAWAASAPSAAQIMGQLALAQPVIGNPTPIPGGPIQPGPAIPVFTEQDVEDSWDDMYQAVFGVALDTQTMDLNLTAAVTGPGALSGTNELSQGFTYTATTATEVDFINHPDLTQAMRDWAILTGMTFHDLTGTISSNLGSYDMTAVSVSWTENGVTNHKLFPSVGDDLVNDRGVDSNNIPAGPQPITQPDTVDIICFSVTVPCIADTPECQGCFDDYDDDVDQARRDHQDALDNAQDAKNACDQGAQDALAVCTFTVSAAYAAAMVACLFVPFPASIACAVGASLAMAAAQAACLAKNWLDRRNCQRAYNLAVNAANRALQNALTTAQQALQNCLSNNNCFGTCTITICIVRDAKGYHEELR